MGFLSKLFKKDNNNEHKTGGMEDYMTLVRVYLQAAIAENAGITNLAVLPDLRMFKTTLHVPTVNNKLGVGEKSIARKCSKTCTRPMTISSKSLIPVSDAIAGRCKMCRLI